MSMCVCRGWLGVGWGGVGRHAGRCVGHPRLHCLLHALGALPARAQRRLVTVTFVGAWPPPPPVQDRKPARPF